MLKDNSFIICCEEFDPEGDYSNRCDICPYKLPSLETILEATWEWQEETFDSSAEDSTSGVIREAKELRGAFINREAKEAKLTEATDVIMFLLYAIKKSGYTIDELKLAFIKKLKENRLREWKKNSDNTFSHVKK
jgi:hypothetical protein